MASFLSMQYDSDSDSVDDLDFEPTSDATSGSDNDSSSDVDRTMEDDVNDDAVEGGIMDTDTVATASSSRGRKKKVTTRPTMAGTLTQGVATVTNTIPSAATIRAAETAPTPSPTVATAMTVPMTVVAGDATAAASVNTADPTTSGEVVKKKKGPKKGTKYKKRTPAGPDGKVPKKMTKKAAAAAAAAAEAAAQEAALQAQRQTLNFGGRLGPMNTRVDMEHPLETFKWPYSPFTNEFKAQHRARDKMVTELHQAVEEITIRNGQASWHLQELDNQLQQSRQDLRTSLDEIQFRKSQLRDMSLLAVDIVRKLSSSSTTTQSSSSALSTSMPTGRRISASSVGSSSGAISGNESGAGEGGYVSSSAASYLDGDQMDVDDAESGGEQHLKLRTAQPQQALKGLNEGNVRSFLEKIRELEQTQRHAAA